MARPCPPRSSKLWPDLAPRAEVLDVREVLARVGEKEMEVKGAKVREKANLTLPKSSSSETMESRFLYVADHSG